MYIPSVAVLNFDTERVLFLLQMYMCYKYRK